ncbi:MAG: serine protease [Lentisphaeria bacterium]|nr:MAG: serine protease [Lentisphaeria bacterium]
MSIVRFLPILTIAVSLAAAVPELSVEGGSLSGRGAVFRSEGATLVATAAHVLLENPDLLLRDATGHAIAIRVLEFAPDRDLVLLEADLPEKYRKIDGKLTAVVPGDSIRFGNRSGRCETVEPVRLICRGVSVKRGDSGGAVTDRDGRLVAVVRGILPGSPEMTEAVRVDNYRRNARERIGIGRFAEWQRDYRELKQWNSRLVDAVKQLAGAALRRRGAELLRELPETVPVGVETLDRLCRRETLRAGRAAAWLGLSPRGEVLEVWEPFSVEAWNALTEHGGAPEVERGGSNWGIRGWREESGRMRWAVFCTEGLFAGKILISPGGRLPEANLRRR